MKTLGDSSKLGKTQEASIFSLEVNYLIRIDQGWLTSVSVLPQNKSRQIAVCCSAMQCIALKYGKQVVSVVEFQFREWFKQMIYQPFWWVYLLIPAGNLRSLGHLMDFGVLTKKIMSFVTTSKCAFFSRIGKITFGQLSALLFRVQTELCSMHDTSKMFKIHVNNLQISWNCIGVAIKECWHKKREKWVEVGLWLILHQSRFFFFYHLNY